MRSWILASALFIAGIGVLACGTMMRRTPVQYVDTGPHFDHAGHLKRGVDCADCHGGEKEEFWAMPPLSACEECHKELDAEKPPEKRAASFYDAEGKNGIWRESRRLDAEILFPHGAHVLAMGKKCTECHREVEQSTGHAAT